MEVVKGGPAEKVGIKKDDVVITYGNKEVPDSSALRNAVAETPVGREEKVTILRSGKKMELAVKVGNLEGASKLLLSSVKERLGAEVRPPTPKEVEKYGLEPNQDVVVTHVDSKGPLGQAGFEIGDMILAINGQPIEGVDSYVELVGSLKPNQKVTILALDHRTGNTGNILAMVK